MASFVDQLKAFKEKVRANFDEVTNEVTSELAARLVTRSPVDTGRLRANWQFTVGEPAEGEVIAFDPSGLDTISNILSSVTSTGSGNITYIVNNLPYMPVIEYGLYPNPPKNYTGKTIDGFSSQAPTGVRDITVAEFQGIVLTAVRGLSV